MIKTLPEYKINNQTILQEQYDENYEPTSDEIREYAIYIGIEPDKEADLLWLAREGIMKPLPAGWKPCQEENGELYYFNFDTGKSSWDHPCDEIYKARVLEERKRKSSTTTTTLLDTNPRGTFNQTGKSTSSVSDYMSSGKKPFSINNSQPGTTAMNETNASRYHPQYVNSDPEEVEDEEISSSEDDDAPSSDDFRRKVDFGIDPQLSERIEREEKKAAAAAAVSNSMLGSTTTSSMDVAAGKRSEDDHDDNDRIRRANLFAQVAERRLSNGIPSKPSTTNETHDDVLSTSHKDIDTAKLRARLDESANAEKLILLEDNRLYIEKMTTELRAAKERDERILRDKIKADLTLVETNAREQFEREKKFLENRQQNDLNSIKQAIEREKDELQRKLRASMQADLNVLKSTLEQTNSNTQLRALQEKFARDKHEFEEKLRNVENRHKNEVDDLTRRYEQAKIDKDKLEKRLKEREEFCSTLQRNMDQLRGDNASLDRKVQDAEAQIKAIDAGHRRPTHVHTSLSVNSENEDDSDSELAIVAGSRHHREDEEDRLSDTDSDVVQMEQTLKELRQGQLDFMSLLPTSNISMGNIDENHRQSTRTIDLSKLNVADVSPVVRNLRTINRNLTQTHDLTGTISNRPSLSDSGRWPNGLSTFSNNTNPLLMQQTLHRYHQQSSSSTLPMMNSGHWRSQPSLVTREAVLKAARAVFAPGIVDHLSSSTRSSPP